MYASKNNLFYSLVFLLMDGFLDGFLDLRVGDDVVIRDQEDKNDQPQDVGEAPEVSVIDLKKRAVGHLLALEEARTIVVIETVFLSFLLFQKKKITTHTTCLLCVLGQILLVGRVLPVQQRKRAKA